MVHLLLIHCPDESGLIAKITSVLFRHGLNIISNGEFVERSQNHFFMRTEFSGTFDNPVLLRQLKQALPDSVSIKLSGKQKKQVVILATKEHHCLSDLLVRYTFDELHATIKAVISNYKVLEDLTQKFGVPFHYITHDGKSREAHEAEM